VNFFKKNWGKIVAFIFLLAIAILWLVPLTWTMLSSFRSEVEIQTIGYRILPVQFVLTNYIDAITDTTNSNITRWFLNSLFISTTHTILVLITASMSAYAYSRLQFKGRDTLFIIILSTMMLPGVVNLIPSYKIVDMLGWIDNPLAVIIPGVGGVMNIYLIRQFMLGIPKEYDECARMEGAGDFTIFYKIILPLIRPVLTVVALFSFTGSWNDFLWPSIVFNSVESMPLTPGLRLLQGTYGGFPAHLMASAVISIIPTFILYLFAQKYFLEGLALSSGVKG
jgi:multiple sugar transport system permease protein